MFCPCGRKMAGNGVRMQRITEFEDGLFQPAFAEVRRFRCAGCGSTDSMVSPETEPGFRMSGAAAEQIVRVAINHGMKHAGEIAGVDHASVSRLLAARSDRFLEATTRPKIARIGDIGGVLAVSDAWTGDVTACFTGQDDNRIIPWLSRPYPGVLLPSADILSKAVAWTGFKVAVAVDTAMSMLRPLIEKARQRLAALEGDGAVSSNMHSRHFSRTSDRLQAALEASSIGAGRGAVSKWIAECTGVWADVFAPVLRFLGSYQDNLFSHPACLEPTRSIGLELRGPANLMTLALDMRRRVELRHAGPRLDVRMTPR